jgi:DNA polymerase III subunit epsilon
MLELTRPIVFVDLETTGNRYYADRVIEFSALKIHPDRTEEYLSLRVNPGIPISPEALKIHGIIDAQVAGEPTFRKLAWDIFGFLENCDLCGFNILDFDLPLLENEFKRAGVAFSRNGRQFIDTMAIFHKKVPFDPKARRNLETAYLKYCGKELKNAHSAGNDARACAEILWGQLEKYNDLPRDVPGLCLICSSGREDYLDTVGRFVWIGEEAAFNFGKHAGRLLRDIANEHPDYLTWMLGQDFSPEVITVVTEACKGKFPQK